MQFSSLFLKSSMTQANNWRSMRRISWRMVSFIQHTGFVSIVAWKLFTHRRMVLWLGTTPLQPMLKCCRKSRWVTETDSPLLTSVSYTNTPCSTGQVSIVTEVADPEEKNANHLVLSQAYLLSTTHSKDVRFPWVILYITAEEKRSFFGFCYASVSIKIKWWYMEYIASLSYVTHIFTFL